MENRKQSNSNAALSTARAGRYERLGQLSEIAAVLIIAGSAVTVFLKRSPLWMVLAIAGFVIGFVLVYVAIVFATRSRDEALRASAGIRYEITPRRLGTLRIVKAARDALEVLETLQSVPEVIDQNYRLTETDLVRRLVNELGSERANEIKEVVLRYTRVADADYTDESDAPPPRIEALA